MTYDWLLALHVVSAFLMTSALVLFTVLIVVIRRVDTPSRTIGLARASAVGNAAVIVGATGALVFGIWLALDKPAYSIWDGWVLGAIVIWVVAMGTGVMGGKEYERAFARARELDNAGENGPSTELAALNRTQRGALLHAASTVFTLLLLLDMFFKPGA